MRTMKRRRTAILILAGLSTGTGLVGGCKRKAPAAVPPPPMRLVTTAPATQAKAEPLPANFVINGESFTFPAARLVMLPKDGGLRVTLFSDDPPEALKDGYTGNSFYFRFNLDVDSADDLAGQQFVYRNSFTEQDDSTSGLFIAGGRQTLRPVEAGVSFDQVEGQILVHVAGTFRLLDDQKDADPPTVVRVQSSLEPVVGAGKK